MVENEQNTPSVEEAVGSLLSELPAAVREFVQSPERDRIALELTQKYGLHVDQGGAFQLAYIQMLLGAISPDEFMENLKQAGVAEDTVGALASDVNEMVFKPLREKERAASTPTPVPAKEASSSALPPPPSPPERRPPVPSPSYAPESLRVEVPPAPAAPMTPAAPIPVAQPMAPYQKQTPAPMNLPSASVPFPAPEPVHTQVRPVPPPAMMPLERAAAPASSELGGLLRTMQSDMLAVNEHREPTPVPYHSGAIPAPAAPTPTYNPPAPKPAPPAPRPQVTPQQSMPQPVDYTSGDPYREPF